MKKLLLYIVSFFVVSCFFSRCVICKMRWRNEKAYAVFESKQAPLSIHDTVIAGRNIHYAVSGSDSLPTLVFTHGSPGSWFHYMKFMWDADLLKKFRVVTIDRPGFGFSDFGDAMHLQEQCRVLLPLLQQLKTKQPMYLCGHSYGGSVAAKLAADAPTLFEKVVIVAGALDPALEKKEVWRHVVNVKPLYWLMPGAYQVSNTELLYLKKDLHPLANDFHRITTHVIFIHGDKDTWVPIENVAYGKKMMVNARSITVDTLRGADHQVPWKNREEMKRVLLRL
jgi:pimeloyl-ACP methyl ester carboxylesterase